MRKVEKRTKYDEKWLEKRTELVILRLDKRKNDDST